MDLQPKTAHVRSAISSPTVTQLIQLNWPVTSFSGSGSMGIVWANPNNHAQPFLMPDANQANGVKATIFLPGPALVMNGNYTYSPYYILECRENLWTVDKDGADIEEVIADGDLPMWGTTPFSGVIHGQTYWAANNTANVGRFVCGFRGAIVTQYATVSITLGPQMLYFT